MTKKHLIDFLEIHARHIRIETATRLARDLGYLLSIKIVEPDERDKR